DIIGGGHVVGVSKERDHYNVRMFLKLVSRPAMVHNHSPASIYDRVRHRRLSFLICGIAAKLNTVHRLMIKMMTVERGTHETAQVVIVEYYGSRIIPGEFVDVFVKGRVVPEVVNHIVKFRKELWKLRQGVDGEVDCQFRN